MTERHMELPMIIVEFGQQRKRIRIDQPCMTMEQFLAFLSQTFQIKFDLIKHNIFMSDIRLDRWITLDFCQLNNNQRFQIRINTDRLTSSEGDSCSSSFLQSSDCSSSTDQMTIPWMFNVEKRLSEVTPDIVELTARIDSLYTNYQYLIEKLNDDDNLPDYVCKPLTESSSSTHNTGILTENSVRHHWALSTERDLTVPPGFLPLPQHQLTNNQIVNQRTNTSPEQSESTDEGIDRDAGSVSVFESAVSEYELESVYLECREDATIINKPLDSNLAWRNEPAHPRPHWNNGNVARPPTTDKTRSKKPVNLHKAPLPAEKKKNIPCKYAAGGNCKRGSQCRFIHVV